MKFLGRQAHCKACGTVVVGNCDRYKDQCMKVMECRDCSLLVSRENLTIEYCEKMHLQNTGTAKDMRLVLVEVGEPKYKVIPHLDVTCKKCGFTWLEACDDIEDGSD